MAEVKQMVCGTCRWAVPIGQVVDDEPQAECHGVPPTVLVLDGQVLTVWPEVRIASDYCGQWAER